MNYIRLLRDEGAEASHQEEDSQAELQQDVPELSKN